MATLRIHVNRSAAAACEESNGNARGVVPARFQFDAARENLWLKHRAIWKIRISKRAATSTTCRMEECFWDTRLANQFSSPETGRRFLRSAPPARIMADH